jgi:hypothetical protein
MTIYSTASDSMAGTVSCFAIDFETIVKLLELRVEVDRENVGDRNVIDVYSSSFLSAAAISSAAQPVPTSRPLSRMIQVAW